MKKSCIAMLLAGGQGSRLYALTQSVAKPSVPFGGKYRISGWEIPDVCSFVLSRSFLLSCDRHRGQAIDPGGFYDAFWLTQWLFQPKSASQFLHSLAEADDYCDPGRIHKPQRRKVYDTFPGQKFVQNVIDLTHQIPRLMMIQLTGEI